MLPDSRSVISTGYRETLIAVNGLQNLEGYVTSETKRSRNTSLDGEICYVLNNFALHIVKTERLKL